MVLQHLISILSFEATVIFVVVSIAPSCTFIAQILAKQLAPNFEKLNLPTFKSFR